jgi:hypothetical protein
LRLEWGGLSAPVTGPARDIVARRIGREGQPIVIVDGFHPAADALRDAACGAPFGPAREGYPGLRAALPPDYLAPLRDTIAGIFAEVFGCRRSVRVLDMSFSMVTTPPERLTLEQRLPHVDSVEPNRLAMVHYLGTDDLGGTAFFRHRSTGFETLDAVRAPDYLAALSAELKECGPPPPAYITDGAPLFDRIDCIEPRFNCAIFYRSALLHNGQIDAARPLSADPATGRLTATAFFEAD